MITHGEWSQQDSLNRTQALYLLISFMFLKSIHGKPWTGSRNLLQDRHKNSVPDL
jgi:hypothetical protein